MYNCNKCLAPFGANTQVAITACNHTFCVPCAKEIVHTGGGCPVCGADVLKSSVKVVVHQRDSADAKHMLCGQSPEFITQSCASALRFHNEQIQFELDREAQNQIDQERQNFASFQESVKAKLTEIHGAYKRYKGKCSDLAEEQASLIKDRNELQDKYAQKTAQARRLQEICENLQRENQKLKKIQGAPLFDARSLPPAQEVSEGSHHGLQRSRRQPAPTLARAKAGAYSQTTRGRQPEVYPKTRARPAVSEVSSFHTPPRATASTGFRANKKRIFEIANAPSGSQWDRQWPAANAAPAGHARGSGTSLRKQSRATNRDPFEISTNPIEFLN